MHLLYIVFFLILFGCILSHSEISLYYALSGLNLWYNKMIPALLPFMILSSIMIRMKLTEKFAAFSYPIIHPIFKVSKNACYAIVLGFLCGFPMGAKVIGELYENKLISKHEGEFLLAFCNNIGPVYFCSFVIPLLQRELLLPYLIGMYGIPLLYGWILRHTAYKDLTSKTSIPWNADKYIQKHSELVVCNTSNVLDECKNNGNLLEHIDGAIHSSLQSILNLGGYMILFNMMNLLPHVLLGKPILILAPVLEITSGLSLLQDSMPLFSLMILHFGGFSCIAQTYSCIKNTPLSIKKYILHKIILTTIAIGYYILWYVLSPDGFLR